MTTASKTTKTTRIFKSAIAVKITNATRNKLRYVAMSSGTNEVAMAGQIVREAMMDPQASVLKQIKTNRISAEFATRTLMSNVGSNNRAMSQRSKYRADSRFVYSARDEAEKTQLTVEAIARGISRPVLVAKILELALKNVNIPKGFKQKKFKVSKLVQMPIAASEMGKLPSKKYTTRAKALAQLVAKNLNKVSSATLKRIKMSTKEPKIMVPFSITNAALAAKLEVVAKKLGSNMGQVARACCIQ